jgi:hypothetical protein
MIFFGSGSYFSVCLESYIYFSNFLDIQYISFSGEYFILKKGTFMFKLSIIVEKLSNFTSFSE